MMARHPTPLWFSLLGLVFALAGLSKLVGIRPQRALFAGWGWTDQSRQTVGALELAGASLLVTNATRGLGGLMLASTSAVLLATEGRHHNDVLVPPRAALLLGALTALI